ncbi:MAG: fumarylacetoacetate hydrolase family protein [Spirochaetes bacterium]|nr:fumarylacetoacetate hydrolase family protein [Spirochaetota bacterium]
MHIIRFLDEQNNICLGHSYEKDNAVLLSGGLFSEEMDTGKKVRVIKLLAPVVPPAILCIGLNYKEHAGETGFKLPEYPVLFMKNPAAVANPNDPIIIPRVCANAPEVDYEIELAVVIGRTAKNVSAANALDYVFGYTIGNDVSARRWQMHAGSGQWVRGKSFDTFCPLGPVLATSDEIPDPQSLELTCCLNGNVMQKANTSDMIFTIAELVAYLSEDTTLLPGTVIMSGTPGGVGYARKPPVYLKPGDKLELKINNIGTLVNTVSE